MLHRVLLPLILLAAPATSLAEPAWRHELQLLTVGPGAGWLDRYGHTLIAVGRVRPGRIESVVYDLASPESGSPASLGELLLGGARVRALRVGTVSRAVSRYAATNRDVWAQRLALDAGQLAALHAALQAELEEPPRPLSPVRASGAARVRDLLDRVLDGALRRRLQGPAVASLRELHRRALAEDPAALLALDLFLGRRLDRPVDRFEAAGLALELRDTLARGDPPLSDPARPVLSRRAPARPAAASSPASIAALVLAAGLLLLGAFAWRSTPGAHRLAGLFLLLGPVPLGLLGGAQLLLMAFSELPEARANELPIFFLPTDLALIVPAIAWLRATSRRPGRLLAGYAWARLALAAAGLTAHLLGVLRQEPRALLAPALIGAVGVLLLVKRSARGKELGS